MGKCPQSTSNPSSRRPSDHPYLDHSYRWRVLFGTLSLDRGTVRRQNSSTVRISEKQQCRPEIDLKGLSFSEQFVGRRKLVTFPPLERFQIPFSQGSSSLSFSFSELAFHRTTPTPRLPATIFDLVLIRTLLCLFIPSYPSVDAYGSENI